MIPSSLVSGKLNITEGTAVEFSVLELAPKGFLFRIAGNLDVGQPLGIKIIIRLPFSKANENVRLTLKDWSLEQRAADRYFQMFYAEVRDLEYKKAVRHFSAAYLDYVDAKLNLEEAELAQKYTDYPAAEEAYFSTDFAQWKKKMLGEAMAAPKKISEQWLQTVAQIPERMICVNTRRRREQFLMLEFSDFLNVYWQESGLQGCPTGRIQIDGLIFGSGTCRHLVPEMEELQKLILHAQKAGLRTVVALPPMKTEETEARKVFLSALACADPAARPDEIEINDFGTAELVHQLPGKPFRMRLGILMNRHTKDPRQKWRNQREEPETNLLNAPFYLEYLKEQFNISAFSAETWPGCAQPEGDTALYLPYIQTNTGGHCPLRAMCLTGDRGNAGEMKSCRGFCEESVILYPDFLKTVAIQNSVYTLRTEVLENAEELKKVIGQSTTRLVFNFF